jgi:hypothetical protein
MPKPSRTPRTRLVALNALVQPAAREEIEARAAADERSVCSMTRLLLDFALREFDGKRRHHAVQAQAAAQSAGR